MASTQRQGVSFDARAVTLNGKRTLLIGGSLHYPKIHHTQWERALQLAKECGLNFLDTYVFWNVHEKERGKFTFTEESDIFRFLQLAHHYELMVMLRLGPYICAETSYGGFPYWLKEIPGISFRTYNEPFMHEVKRWLLYITRLLKKHKLFYPQGGPIILVQLENEYDLVSNIHQSMGQQYLQWYSDLYRELSTDVPLIMCKSSPEEVAATTSPNRDSEFSNIASNENCIETLNSFYGHKKIAGLKERKPNQPVIWTEFWIGWYNIWTSAPRKRSIEDVIYAALRFIAQGGAGLSYYMFHGGTHFGNLAMYAQTTSYYFDSPIDEYGRPTFRFHMLKQINQLLHSFSQLLLSCDDPQVLHLLPEVFAFIWKDHASHKNLIFLCNDSKSTCHVSCQGCAKKMNPLSVTVLWDNKIVLDSSSASFDWQRPFLGLVEELEDAYFHPVETFELAIPTHSTTKGPSGAFSDLPDDMLIVTKDQTDYMWYVACAARPNIHGSLRNALIILDVEMADIIHLFINQKYIGSSWVNLEEEGRECHFSLEFPNNTIYPIPDTDCSTSSSQLDIAILACSLGLIKGEFQLVKGATMEHEKKGIWKEPSMRFFVRQDCSKNNNNNEDQKDSEQSIPVSFLSWTTIPLYVMKDNRDMFIDSSHPIKAVEQTSTFLGPKLYQQTIVIHPKTRNQIKSGLVIDFSCMTKGIFRWNSFCCGRYYISPVMKEHDEELKNAPIQLDRLCKTTQRYYYIPQGIVQETNQLQVFEEIGGNFDQLRIFIVS